MTPQIDKIRFVGDEPRQLPMYIAKFDGTAVGIVTEYSQANSLRSVDVFAGWCTEMVNDFSLSAVEFCQYGTVRDMREWCDVATKTLARAHASTRTAKMKAAALSAAAVSSSSAVLS